MGSIKVLYFLMKDYESFIEQLEYFRMFRGETFERCEVFCDDVNDWCSGRRTKEAGRAGVVECNAVRADEKCWRKMLRFMVVYESGKYECMSEIAKLSLQKLIFVSENNIYNTKL